MRGQKADIHISKEIVQLCEIIDSEGESISEENPDLKGICFGDLFSVSILFLLISTAKFSYSISVVHSYIK